MQFKRLTVGDAYPTCFGPMSMFDHRRLAFLRTFTFDAHRLMTRISLLLETLMRFTLVLSMFPLALAVMAAAPACGQALNQIGRQSQNEGMTIVPAPGKMTIDGDLKDWDWSGRIWVFADTAVRDRYSVEAAGMWDKDNLYLAARWKAPLPMLSLINPDYNPDDGWKQDSWQMRIATPDRTLWVTTWYYTPRKQPVMHLAYWKDANRYSGTEPAVLLAAPPGGTLLGQGAEMAYKADPDGKGFTQEIKIPWKLLFKETPEIKAGMTIRMGNEFLWSDPTGKTWPVHRYADNMQPGVTTREFYFTDKNAWGNMTLSSTGQIPVRQYRSDTGRVVGTVPVRVTIPADAARFTVVIDDRKGQRVRTLAADCDPADYRVAAARKDRLQTVEIKWDCQDDRGKLVLPGTYSLRGLTHKGLSASYEMSFYNPGTPPWPTRDGSGAWGADHSGPAGVATGGSWTLIAFPVVEGGSGIIGLDSTGRKRWGIRPATTNLTADEDYVYADVGAFDKDEVLNRFNIKDGSQAPFVQNGTPRNFHLTLSDILGQPTTAGIAGMAVHGEKLVLSLTEGKLLVLDAHSAAVVKHLDVANVTALAFSHDGKLYGLIDAKPCRIELDTGAATPIATPGLGTASALAVDADGNLLIADTGPDSQVKAYTPEGAIAYTCGKRGGRPIRGAFDDQAMSHVSSVASDASAHIWVTENWDYPRRVSVWGRDGKLVRDYIGNAHYAGGGSTLHDQDPTLGYVGPVEVKLDKAAGTWKVTQVLWVPDETRGESFNIPGDTQVQRFTSTASGTPHEYMFEHDTGNVLFMQRNGGWQPVSAICLAGNISGRTAHDGPVQQQPTGELAGLNAYDVVVWNDLNGDGKVQRSECTVLPATRPGDARQRGETALPIGIGWGGRIGDDLRLFTDGLACWKPVRFTDDGAPIYSLEGRTTLGVVDRGEEQLSPGEDRVVCLSMVGYAGPTRLVGVDLKTNSLSWYYPNPYPGVHGSHNATMPRPGLLVGPNKIMGFAHVSDPIGNVFALRGNLGQDFFLTTDGLYVGALFQDCRLPGELMPGSEAELKAMPLEGMTEGGEPFNGWFGKQSDGVIRMTTGMFAREASSILQIHGLDTITRFNGGAVTVDAVAIVRADADTAARAKKPAEPKRYAVTRLARAPRIDGNPGDWSAIPRVEIEREGLPARATARLAYDDANLYVQFEVSDSTPWLNEGKDVTRLFKTGDAVDLQIGLDTQPHGDPRPGDQRLVFAQLGGKPVVVRMVPIDRTASPSLRVKYASPVGVKVFDRVEALAGATVNVKVEGNRYRVQAAIPLATLGIVPKSGLTLKGDLGFISSDASGTIDTARTYWSNLATNLVNDLPIEAWLSPNGWGEFNLQ